MASAVMDIIQATGHGVLLSVFGVVLSLLGLYWVSTTSDRKTVVLKSSSGLYQQTFLESRGYLKFQVPYLSLVIC